MARIIAHSSPYPCGMSKVNFERDLAASGATPVLVSMSVKRRLAGIHAVHARGDAAQAGRRLS